LRSLGAAFQTKTIDVDGTPVKCQFWDLAGQERCKTITPSFYKGVSGVILTYAVDSKESFDKIETWMAQAMKDCGQDACKILIGNKTDRPRQVSTDEGEKKAECYKIKFFETSAELGENVDQAFKEFIRDIKVNILDKSDTTLNIRLANQERNNNNQRSGCCS